jgi:hypothetical protein
VSRRRAATWAAWSQDIGDALDAAHRAETSETALAAGDALHGLMERLQDYRAESRKPLEWAEPALIELGTALDQVNRLRLSKRKFLDASAEEMVEELGKKDAVALFERKYLGRYVRWKVKFKGKRDSGVFLVNVGEQVEAACTLDPSVQGPVLEQLERWQVITLEGRLDTPGASGSAEEPSRARFVFDHCVIR